MPKREIRCRDCGRVIRHEWYWYRVVGDWKSDEVKVEYYCNGCASCRVDERYTNNLLCAFAM